jgi:DNA-binding SARP family transcriptional activator
MHTIRLLGGASIEFSNGHSPGRAVQRARMAMLASLALSRTRSASRDRLMALLWPEHDTDRARHLLREGLYRLRESLGDDALLAAGDEIRLNGATRCDVWDMEEAADRQDWAAVDRLYAGPLLDGFFLSDTPEFERLVEDERARLAALHAQALESLAAGHAERGEWAAAVRCWRRLAAMDPFNGRVARRLMEALDASGDRAAALRHAALHAELLATELGAAPDPLVSSLAELLRLAPPERRMAGDPVVVPDASRGVNPGAAAAGIPYDGIAGEQPTSEVRETVSDDQVVRYPIRPRSIGVALAALGTIALLSAGYLWSKGWSDDLDPNRIAVVPVRTSGADPALAYLRNGFVELLSLEFGGDVGPVAVDAGEVLRAWQRGDTTEPVTARRARELGRELGVGQVVYASLVGTAQRMTLRASIMDVASGSERVKSVNFSGPEDSLPVLVAGISATLLARDAGSWRVSEADPARTNAEVLRAYLAAMVAYRKARWSEARQHLDRALELDSSFAPAMFKRTLIAATEGDYGWNALGSQRAVQLFPLLWRNRNLLTPEQRLLLEAVTDSTRVLRKMEALPRLEHAVALLPNSVEAWDMLGDDYYHAGAFIGRRDWAQLAKHAFQRAIALDSLMAANAQMHLADLAFMDGDRQAHARYALRATGPRGPVLHAYQAAILGGDHAAIRRARVEYVHAVARGEEDGPYWVFRGLTIPMHELDSLLLQLAAKASNEAAVRRVREWRIEALFAQGRPREAIEVMRRANWPESNPDQFHAQLYYNGITPDVAEGYLLRHAPAGRGRGLFTYPMRCNVAISRAIRGDTTGVAAILGSLPAMDAGSPAGHVIHIGPDNARWVVCREVLGGVLSALSPSGMPLLWRADSVMRASPLNFTDWWNHAIATAFARRGEYQAATAASRRYFVDYTPQNLVPRYRESGRWAALAGDTAWAITAYRKYLAWRSDPEPSLAPQRDSVMAELESLVGKGRAPGRR